MSDREADGRTHLGSRGLEVDLGVVRVGKLLQNDGIGSRLGQRLGLGHCPVHALVGGRQHHGGAQCLEQHAALEGHGGGHGQDELVAFGGGHHGQADARVARRGLDERRCAGLDQALLLCLLDHALANAVLDRVARLHRLELEQNIGKCTSRLGNPVKTDNGRAANHIHDGVANLGSCKWRALGHDGLVVCKGSRDPQPACSSKTKERPRKSTHTPCRCQYEQQQ